MSTQEQYAPPEDILSDVLALCHAVARAIELIPPDRPEYRRQACTYALQEIADSVERIIDSESVTAPH